MELKVRINPSSLSRSKLGPIWGDFYLECGGEYFPVEGWDDIVLALANAWLQAVRRVSLGGSPHERFMFMDGPYRVDLSLQENGRVAVDLIKEMLGAEVTVRSLTVDGTELLQDALSVAGQLLDECRSRGWTDDHDVQAMNRCHSEATA